MKIALVVRWLNPVFEQVADQLRSRAAVVDVIVPDDEDAIAATVTAEHDLYVIKSGTAAGFAYATHLHRCGARMVNPYPVVALLRDKLATTRALERAGVRVPETLDTAERDAARSLLASGPIVVKPITGSRGEGVVMVHSEAELDLARLGPSHMVQRFHPADGNGWDRKVFRIGGELFGIERRWPIREYADKLGRPFEVTGELREMALRVGVALGIDLYGVDFVVSDGRPYAVDVNKLGSYMGVPDGPRLLADYLLQALR